MHDNATKKKEKRPKNKNRTRTERDGKKWLHVGSGVWRARLADATMGFSMTCPRLVQPSGVAQTRDELTRGVRISVK